MEINKEAQKTDGRAGRHFERKNRAFEGKTVEMLIEETVRSQAAGPSPTTLKWITNAFST